MKLRDFLKPLVGPIVQVLAQELLKPESPLAGGVAWLEAKRAKFEDAGVAALANSGISAYRVTAAGTASAVPLAEVVQTVMDAFIEQAT